MRHCGRRHTRNYYHTWLWNRQQLATHVSSFSLQTVKTEKYDDKVGLLTAGKYHETKTTDNNLLNSFKLLRISIPLLNCYMRQFVIIRLSLQPQDTDNKKVTGTITSYVFAMTVLSHMKYRGLSTHLLLPTNSRANERGPVRLWDTKCLAFSSNILSLVFFMTCNKCNANKNSAEE